MSEPISASALDTILRQARTYNAFLDREIDDKTLRALYDLYKWGPTSMNCQAGRVIFVRGKEAKEKLKTALMPGNVEKTMKAPVTAIIAHDTKFYEYLPTQFPAIPDAKDMYAGNATLSAETAFRNGSLQGAYLIIAARALGLAAGPMSGFNPETVNSLFLPDGRWKANFLVNLGWGEESGNYPRGPRLDFEESVRIE